MGKHCQIVGGKQDLFVICRLLCLEANSRDVLVEGSKNLSGTEC